MEFLDFIRREGQRTIVKSQGGIAGPAPVETDEHPFTGVIQHGGAALEASKKRPIYKGTWLLDRRPTFFDAVMAQAGGYDIRQRHTNDDWATESSSSFGDRVSEALAILGEIDV